MDGFLNINKAAGLTSFDVIRRLKKLIPKTKLGHLGTLDPMAEGVLPVAVGYATRLIQYVADTDKVYQTAMTLGGVSDTQDAWGRIEYQPVINLDQARLMRLLTKYTGKGKSKVMLLLISLVVKGYLHANNYPWRTDWIPR